MASDILVNGKRSRCNHPWRHELTFELLNRGGLPASREVVLLRPSVDLQWPPISLRC
jgi:hypothetical protein